MTSNRADATRDRVEAELASPLRELGLDLEHVDVTPSGNRRMLRVAVDKDGGVTLDDIADATREASQVLDESDVMGEQPYTLEVTSRGVDRPLTLPRHWRRNEGRLVKVTFTEGSPMTGRVVEAGEEAATVEVSGKHHEITYATVQKALVQVELNRSPSQGGQH